MMVSPLLRSPSHPPSDNPLPLPLARRFEAMGKREVRSSGASLRKKPLAPPYSTAQSVTRLASSHRVHADPDAARTFVDEQIALKREKGYRELTAVYPFGGFGTAFIAKWSQKCSCGCGGKISPGDDIMPLTVNVDTGGSHKWALRDHPMESVPPSTR